jgi:hypothetical protein
MHSLVCALNAQNKLYRLKLSVLGTGIYNRNISYQE